VNRFRPELHVTAETGVLEAPAGAVRQGSNLHVFHQFRPTPDSGARWAHQMATGLPYGWDVCDDVLAPEGDEVECLAGSSVLVSDGTVELFFVTTTPSDGEAVRGSDLPHDRRGARNFRIHRARISDLDAISAEISDDPSIVSREVERLGPVEIDDDDHPVTALVTPSVIRHDDGWLMIALDLVDETAADIVVLTSDDRQHWTALGSLEITGGSTDTTVPRGRPFAPRIVTMTDELTDETSDVLFITYPADDEGSSGGESAGYLVGTLSGTTFTVETGFQLFDNGHDFTRPRVVQGIQPVIVGLVGTFPGNGTGTWANCLSVPRFLTLRGGHLHQDIVGVPSAVRSYTDRAAVFTAQLDVSRGAVTVSLLDEEDGLLATVRHSGDRIEVTRPTRDGVGDVRTAELADGDSDTLTILVDGPVCEVFADGGLVSLTSSLHGDAPFAKFRVDTTAGARVLSAMESLGRRLQRRLAQLDNPEEQERLIAEAALADRDLAADD
jgi:beta-fructofuranosidase